MARVSPSRYVVLSAMMFAAVTVAAQQPIPTIQQPLPPTTAFKYFGYFHTDGRVGDANNETSPYTNTYVAYMCHYDSNLYPDGCSASQFATSLHNAINVYGYDFIYLRLIHGSLNVIDTMIEVARPYWSRVVYIEAIHEPESDTQRTLEYTRKTIDDIQNLIAARNLAQKDMGGVWTLAEINNPNYTFLSAPNLKWVGAEAYAPPGGSAGDAARVTTQLVQAKSRILAAPGLAKNIVFVPQAYNYASSTGPGYTNTQELIKLQDSPYLQGFNDPRVTGLFMFAYGRGGPNAPGELKPNTEGGTQDLPHVRLRHVKQSAALRQPDFNTSQDFRPDLILHNQDTGEIRAWLMNGINRTSEAALTPVTQVTDTQWKIVGTGDFNADGRPDLVWEHLGTGALSVWFMNGLQRISGESIPYVAGGSWHVRAVSDVNADGWPDLLWQDATGWAAVWTMKGLQRIEGHLLTATPNADLDWKMVGAGDLDHDGFSDLVWHHQTSGQLAWWKLNGDTQVSGDYLTPSSAPLDWRLRGAVDLNKDGHVDLVWQNTMNDQISVWFMNGRTLASGELLNPSVTASTAWFVSAPR